MNKLKGLLYISFLLVILPAVYAQPGGGGDPGGGQPVPIGGIWVLLAIGGAFGIKRFLDIRNRNKQQ
jgi:hypothetical protein